MEFAVVTLTNDVKTEEKCKTKNFTRRKFFWALKKARGDANYAKT